MEEVSVTSSGVDFLVETSPEKLNNSIERKIAENEAIGYELVNASAPSMTYDQDSGFTKYAVTLHFKEIYKNL